MHYDFKEVPDQDPIALLPEGVYPCRIQDVRPGSARDGSERWSYRLEIVEGEWAGRTGAWDALTWSERGVFRVKKVLEALGFDVHGELHIEPEELDGIEVLVTLREEEYEGANGKQRRMAVPYLGYTPRDPSPHPEPEGVGGAMPF